MRKDKQPLDVTEGSTMESTVGLVNVLKVAAAPQNLAQSAEASTKRNLSHLDEASTSTPIINRLTEVDETPQYVNKTDDETIGFLLDRAKRGHYRRSKGSPTICKVSRMLRDLSESSFNPQLVSIGPIHIEDSKLQEFEWLKECYLDDLLERRYNVDSTQKKTLIEACLEEVNTLMDEIKESYGGMIEKYSGSELARMMVMDGCFILEFCFKHEEEDLHLPNKMQNSRIAMDLMLLENQVPFSVLQVLFGCTMGETRYTLCYILDKHLAPYIKLFCSLLPEENSTTDVDSDSTHDTADVGSHDHVLSYMHKRYQHRVVTSRNPNTYTTFHAIVELDRSGMNFMPHQLQGGWSMTFKFESSLFSYLPSFRSEATLQMPTLVIHNTTELILRNFIAYEQSFPQGCYYFTSYAHAMDMLIDTQEDIAKLLESKVLVNTLGSNQEAANMINKICKNISVTEFYYTEEFKQVDKYYNAFWPKHMALLRRVYFNNPWSIFALLAAFILFTFTGVQTYFTARG